MEKKTKRCGIVTDNPYVTERLLKRGFYLADEQEFGELVYLEGWKGLEEVANKISIEEYNK